jgi:hypothetical protein
MTKKKPDAKSPAARKRSDKAANQPPTARGPRSAAFRSKRAGGSSEVKAAAADVALEVDDASLCQDDVGGPSLTINMPPDMTPVVRDPPFSVTCNGSGVSAVTISVWRGTTMLAEQTATQLSIQTFQATFGTADIATPTPMGTFDKINADGGVVSAPAVRVSIR